MRNLKKRDLEHEQIPANISRTLDQFSDEDLIQVIASGAMWAMEQLFVRYSRMLYALAYRMVTDQQVAEDLVQEVLLAVWRRAASYTPQLGTARSWLFSIMHHRTIDYLRRVRRRSILKQTKWEEVDLDERMAVPDVWNEAWRSVQSELVRTALTQLSPEQQRVIELAYFQGWTHTEIAERLQLPLGTVKARIRLGLIHLKRILERIGVQGY
jgi:RNA polymerase sigma-70 factor, ECF subfamily